MTKIDDILDEMLPRHHDAGDYVRDTITIPKAKSALYDLILKEVIGSDDTPINADDEETFIENDIREMMRKKAKELFDD